MKNLRIALLMFVGAFLASPIMAQDATPAAPDNAPSSGSAPGGRHHRRPRSVDDQMEQMTKRLSLTDDQQPKVRAILQDQHDQMAQMMHDSSMSHDDKMAKMKDMHESSSAKIREVLNDDQKAKFDASQQHHMDHMQKHGQMDGQAPPAPPSN